MLYSLCIEMLYEDKNFISKFESAFKDGFKYCEFWRWKNQDLKALKNLMQKTGLCITAFSGDDEFSMTDSKEHDLYLNFLEQSLKQALYLNCPYLVVHTDALNPDDGSAKPSVLSFEERLKNTYALLYKAVNLACTYKITLLLEVLNTHVDHKNYFLNDPQLAFEIAAKINSPYLKILYDIYHCQIMQGNIINTIKNNLSHIGYIHFADVPTRTEPTTGELDCKNIIKNLKNFGFQGFFGFELCAKNSTKEAIEKIHSVINH